MVVEYLKSNLEFWKRENYRSNPEGMLLYENYYNGSPQLCYGISKIALCIAKSLNLTPSVLLPWHDSPVSRSMCDKQFQIKDKLFLIIIKHFLVLLYTFFTIDKKALLKLKIGKDMIGPYMYDSIIRRFNKKTIVNLSIKERIYICFELCHYFYFSQIFREYPIKAVVLGDNVYRYGYLFEICKNRRIKCFAPVNLNTVFIEKYTDSTDFKSNYLTSSILDELSESVDYKKVVSEYFKKRYSGSIEQHDVLSAYANKSVTNLSSFVEKYKLDSSKKTVVIMSHVFADAPHCFSDSLYNDYWEWFVNTFNCLILNQKINLLVKEHPSAHLYGQKGLINEFLLKNNHADLQVHEDESTLSILNNADVVVTCGGTIGLEMACMGKNVILAQKPPYSGLGFTIDFNSRNEYESFLLNGIQDVSSLNSTQIDVATKTAYALFCRANNWTPDLELGGDIIYMGKHYDNNDLFNNIIKYNHVELTKQHIYRILDSFIHSERKHFFSNN